MRGKTKSSMGAVGARIATDEPLAARLGCRCLSLAGRLLGLERHTGRKAWHLGYLAAFLSQCNVVSNWIVDERV